MRKLCIAVIVLSFIGFGPLKSFFHNVKNVEGKSPEGIPIIQALKNSSEIFSNKPKVKNFLITEVDAGSKDKAPRATMILKYDEIKNKLMVAPITLPTVGKSDSIKVIKIAAEKKYHVAIAYCFIFEPSGIARIIDLLAPNGIKLNFGNKELTQLKTNNHPFNGKELVSFIEQANATHNQYELKAVFSALKKEIAKNQSPEKLFSLAPTIFSEFFKSVKTDLGKRQLMSLGITALLNPIKTIEPVKLAPEEGINNQAVNSPLEKVNPPMFN